MASEEFDMRLRLEAERRRRNGASVQPVKAEAPARPARSASSVFGSSMIESVLNGAMALPSAAGDLLAGATSVTESLAAPFVGEEMAFKRRFQEQQNMLPASLIRAIPRPTVQGYVATMQSLPALMPGGKSFGDAYAINRDQLDVEEAQDRAAHPVASIAGDISGDMAALAMGKAPFGRAIGQAEKRLLPKVADISFGAASKVVVQPGIRRTLERALNAETPRRLARGAGRSAEAGLEAAVLEVMNDKDADPIEAASLAAGGQAMGSLALEGGSGLLSGGLLKSGGKIALTAAAMGAIWQVVKSASPGGRDRVLESIESGFNKVAYSVMLGGVATMAGAPRYRDTKLAEEIPALVEGLAAVPRGLTLSLITRYAKADPAEQARFEGVLGNLARDPEYKGQTPEEQIIVRSIKGASPTKVSGVIDRSKYNTVNADVSQLGAQVNQLGQAQPR